MYNQKVYALPMEASSIGKDWDTAYTDTQRKKMHTDMAIPLLRLENISAITTNAKGPREIAKKAI